MKHDARAKKIKQAGIISGILLALITGIILGRWSAPPGEKTPSPEKQRAEQPARMWTCSMHPQILQPKPGQCPICAMDLIPVETGPKKNGAERRLVLSDSAKKLAQIATAPVERRFPEAEVRMSGKVAFDETRLRALTTHFPIRVERLYVDYTGMQVRPGDHLALIFSPQLSVAQGDLLSAIKYPVNDMSIEAARDKLRLWGLSERQIQAIEERGTTQDYFELEAPIGGAVIKKNIREGDYARTGDVLFKIADLSRVWVLLDAFESDLAWLHYGQEARIEIEAYPGGTFRGRIAFIHPALDERTRTVKVRVNLANEDGRLKPGMLAKGVIKTSLAAGGKIMAPELAGKWICPMHPDVIKEEAGTCDICGMALVTAEEMGYTASPRSAPLVVPAPAVLRTGKRAVVYVEKPGQEEPTYEGREITLGPKAGDVFIVESGLEEGERVVVQGAFKIDSALQIQAKPSMMNPKDGETAPGHAHHSGMDKGELGRGTGGPDGGKKYPLDVCVVTGLKLGSMGPPVIYEYQDREVRFCCQGCVSQFEENPEKYLRMLDAVKEEKDSHDTTKGRRHD